MYSAIYSKETEGKLTGGSKPRKIARRQVRDGDAQWVLY